MSGAGAPLQDRHLGTQQQARWLRPNPRLEGRQAEVVTAVWELVEGLLEVLGDGPELTAGLRKLREAKDCLVLQSLEDGDVR